MSEADSRVDRMARAARDPVVVLHKFNKLRSKEPERLVLVVEGDEDPIFYSVIAQRCGAKEGFLALVAGGKDLVLGFRELLKASLEAKRGAGVAFAVDRDFDDLKGFSSGVDLYCTPAYSIENIACSSVAIRSLLYHEFKLHDPELLDDVDRITKLYDGVCAAFAAEVHDINLLIYFGRTESARRCGASIRDIEESANRVFSLNSESLAVSCAFKGDAASEIVRFTAPVSIADAAPALPAFSALEPRMRWRGKFWFALVVRFLSILVEDRNSTNPRFFTRGRGKVKLNLATDSAFRLLASACEVPPCMNAFFAQLPANALR